ncbi:MAG: anaerobic glycerol-3-phosphate dehydrogenase subunit GlpC [Pseudomonadota bacterium]
MINLENISFDHCLKCTVCTVYCPVARVTHRYPGPKQAGPDTERLRIKNPELVDESLKYCNNCKRCEIACPSDVKIADIIQNAKGRYFKPKFRLRDYMLSRTDLMGRVGTATAPVFNLFSSLTPVKAALDLLLKIPAQRSFPRYRRGTFSRRFEKQAHTQDGFKEKVVYFHGCYVNYLDHGLGRTMVQILNKLNIGVRLTREKCCGVPLIANGYLDEAKKNAVHNLDVLGRALDGQTAKIVATSSSCSLALVAEYKNLLQLDDSAISGRVEYITKYLHDLFESRGRPELKSVNLKVAYHAPCHLERMGGAIFTVELLRAIPGLDLKLLNSECCGISGTYGFKKEFYSIGLDVGADLFRKIAEVDPDVVVTDCETCKWQIEANTTYTVVHPISLLAQALL